MITKVNLFFALIMLQNIFLINSALTAENYVEVDKIIAIVETQTITKSDLNKKKKATRKVLSQQNEDIPSEKKITKLSLDQLITEKLVIEYASMQGISISEEQLNNVMNSIAESNNLSIEDLIEEIEEDGSSFAEFRETVRIQLLFDQVKKRIIGANIKISEFEIDSFIELQKEKTPTKYNYSHILIENIKNNVDIIDIEKTKNKLKKIKDLLKENNFD